MSTKKKKNHNPYKKYCCVFGCMNRSDKSLTFYNVPKEMERRRAWLKAINREDLLDEKKNKAKYNYVCSAHFNESDFIVTICKRLVNDALPTKCLPHQTPQDPPIEGSGRKTRPSSKDAPVPTYSHAQAQTETKVEKVPDTNTDSAIQKPNIVFMNIEPVMAKPDNQKSTATPVVLLPRIHVSGPAIPRTTSGSQTQTKENSNTEEVMATISTQTDLDEDSIKLAPTSSLVPSTSSLALSTSQSPHKRKVKKEIEFVDCKRQRSEDVVQIHDEGELISASLLLDPEEEVAERIKKLAEWLNKIKNDPEYKLFALNLYYACPHTYRYLQTPLKLPNKSALNKFKFKIPPKLDDRVLYSLSLKMKSLPSIAKYCTISVGEMVLQRNLYYDLNKDEVIGFHNINGSISPEIAKNAYVIMLQGIYYNWKQPIAYAFLGSTVHYAALESWMKKIILKLFNVGIEVKAVISNQNSYFNKYARVIKHVTVDEPYFFADDKKIFYIFDVPSLLKRLRDDLLSNDFYFKKEKISWDHIRTLYEHQKDRKYMLIPKITDAHIDPNKEQKKSLKYAAEIFSNSVHAALETYIDFGQIAEEARPTAKFIEMMDGLFDVLNSSKMKTVKKYQCAFVKSEDQELLLKDAYHMFRTMKAISRATGKDTTSEINTFYNFQISIQAVLQLLEDLKSEEFDYLLTRRLTREHLDLFLKSIEKQCGSDSEPTPITFTRVFSKLFYKSMLKGKEIDNESGINEQLELSENIMKELTKNPPDAPRQSLVSLGGETDHRIVVPKKNALPYVVGFLLFKCYKKHPNCKEFYRAFDCVVNIEQPTFSHYKAYTRHNAFYGSLKMGPSLALIDYVQRLDSLFTRNFEHYLRERPGSQIFKLLQKFELPLLPCRCFPVNYMLKLFVRFRMYITLKYNVRKFRSNKRSTQQYLKMNKIF